MENVFLLLGVNLGDRIQQLARARTSISQHIGPIVEGSQLYETDAWGKEDQPRFLNQVVKVNTTKSARRVLELIQEIETALGRVREVRWDARLIDIDILFYGKAIIDERDLQIPHPLLPQRRFALVPMNEIAPEWMHPVLNQQIAEILEQTDDRLEVTPILN
jgi:2-amino-4-hydroxy-6-hydroxymethyldihydropteridine diphosphokinase